jgi:hypothetical protein
VGSRLADGVLAGLHDFGCARDRASNRQLHYDQYCLLVLLALFNPVVRSLRAIQQASTMRKVQKRLLCPRTSLGSLSEAVDVFDPSRLEAIIGDLLKEVPHARHEVHSQAAVSRAVQLTSGEKSQKHSVPGRVRPLTAEAHIGVNQSLRMLILVRKQISSAQGVLFFKIILHLSSSTSCNPLRLRY